MAQGIGNPKNRLELRHAVNLRVIEEHSKHAVLLYCSVSGLLCGKTNCSVCAHSLPWHALRLWQDIPGRLSESLCTSGQTCVSFVANTPDHCVPQDQLHT